MLPGMAKPKPSLIHAILTLRCARCREGRVHATFWQMNEFCPVCGLKFEREPGYYLMGIFFGYVINAIIFLPICIALYLLGVTWQAYVGVGVAIVLLSPLVLRYSRVVWLHVDEFLDPRTNEK